MDITRYVDAIRRELAVVAAAGGEEALALADRLTAPLESAIRLTLLDALSTAAAEITRDLAPGSVHVRLRGQDPDFVVAIASPAPPVDEPPAAPMAPIEEKGGTSRINLRLPDDLKARVEEAAERERLSVNAWLVRVAAAALEPGRGTGSRSSSGSGRYTGWVR
jgi:hypothetical protein